MKPKRIGVFGGTFDPVHLGHTQLARAAYEQCCFDEMIIVPCALPPHRSIAQATNEQRLMMLSLAFSDFENIRISDYEIGKTTLSYTVETLEYFYSQQPEAQWFFCLGGDSLVSFMTWYRWQDILAIANLVVMARSKMEISELAPELCERFLASDECLFGAELPEQKKSEQKGAGKIVLLDQKEMTISATEIRQHLDIYADDQNKIENDEKLSKWLNPEVLNYVSQNKVYQ